MRVFQVAPPWIEVPPPAYGGTEAVVDALCRALARRGHEVALFAPDHVRDNFLASTDHGGHDGDGRGMRYLEWMWDPDPGDSTYLVDYVYALRQRDGSVHVEHDRHVEGLFPRDRWLELLTATGFEPTVVPFEHSELDPGRYIVFGCRKP